ncbi:MAG: RtcB family protein [Legionella longbeachae]|nr:RtcB family protein [Legionella longbeachae]
MTNCIQILDKVKAWTKYVDFADNAQEQVAKIASLPFIFKYVAVMPDVHLGKGATVGSVIPTKSAIIPAAVGVDIGCGMIAVRTNLFAHQLPDNLLKLRLAIEKAIPVGFNKWNDHTVPDLSQTNWQRVLKNDFQLLLQRHPALRRKNQTHEVFQLGTLGGGNHFIEVCLDEHQQVWFMLHSGSRGIGNSIGQYFIELAKMDMGQLLGTLPDKDLAYFSQGTKHFEDYFFAVNWAQKYALINREVMMKTLTTTVEKILGHSIEIDRHVVNCHHNYVAQERHFGQLIYVTRKGAVSAKKDELGIIPGSMGAQSFIVRGLGNKESFHSCSHGAGRIMSRHQAKKLISLTEHKEATRHVECRKDKAILDESPKAYKPIEQVMQSQQDLVNIEFTLRQIICVKG